MSSISLCFLPLSIASGATNIFGPRPCRAALTSFHFCIRANFDIILVNLPTFSQTLTSALLPAHTSAFYPAPSPNRVKALVLINPHNPFGQRYPANVLLVHFCSARAIHLVSCEVYAMSEFPSSAEPAVQFISLLALDMSTPFSDDGTFDRSRVHVVWSISKESGTLNPAESEWRVSLPPLIGVAAY